MSRARVQYIKKRLFPSSTALMLFSPLFSFLLWDFCDVEHERWWSIQSSSYSQTNGNDSTK